MPASSVGLTLKSTLESKGNSWLAFFCGMQLEAIAELYGFFPLLGREPRSPGYNVTPVRALTELWVLPSLHLLAPRHRLRCLRSRSRSTVVAPVP